MAQNKKVTYSIFDNSRFYILVSSVLLSIFLAGILKLRIPADQLYYIRTEQVFGFVSIIYWYIAVIISPIGYVVGKKRMIHIEFARRAIGVSAAYFAVLHMSVALWGQLGGLSELLLLPNIFKWSIGLGFVAVLILLIMAATSFDKVVKIMTFTRWKWLHRLVYFGVILVVLHIWLIGTHLAYSWAQIAAFVALVLLSGLESFRFFKILSKKTPIYSEKKRFIPMFLSVWLLWVTLIYALPVFVENYHTRHHDTSHVLTPEDFGSHGHTEEDKK